ncbi:MAG: PRC-barrel domain-containing protein [Peptococcales bacterium]
MRKVSELINLPIINLTSGIQITKVTNVILNADNDILEGFICDNKLLPLEKIKNIGKDAIMVEANDIALLLEPMNAHVNAPLFLPNYIENTPIVTEQGKYIGIIGDVLVESNTGKIIGYEVSDGLLKDLVKGRSIITVSQIITYGEDAIVINDD